MKEKYALLDTDFISKTHLIRKDEENKLIDRITEMPGYRFYCHEQIKTELQRHNIAECLANRSLMKCMPVNLMFCRMVILDIKNRII